ncbi:unnamed protein product [Prorocentrum cordatum]|uniref:RRM domain-containing protein n=1 Tax=Prorocentrum cordatum TaxID=2364126 RepID=A0ABN9WTQ3_9DINO|nr:unnamed protein product [Polarella glacialis]CAK0890498.1 unnamed protein product [Polarella glacialis]
MLTKADSRCFKDERMSGEVDELVGWTTEDFEVAMREAAAREECATVGEAGGKATAAASCKLFVGGLSAQTSTEALRAHFSKYGWLVDAVAMSKAGRPRGFGFVTYDSPGPAAMALVEPQWLDGRLVDVKRAVPGERTPERASSKVFVGGLSQDVTTDDLRAYFGAYSPVADAVVMVDRRTSRSRGFGFVRFGSGAQGSAAAEAVLLDSPKHRLAGKWVEVKRATPAAALQELSPTTASDGAGSPASLAMMEASAAYMMDVLAWPDAFAGAGFPSGVQAASPLWGAGRGHTRGRRGRRRKGRMGGDAGDGSDRGEGEQQMIYCDSPCGHGSASGSPFGNSLSGLDLPPGLPVSPAAAVVAAGRAFQAASLGAPLAPLGLDQLCFDMSPASMAGRLGVMGGVHQTNGFGDLGGLRAAAAKLSQGDSENNASRANRAATPPRCPHGSPGPNASPMKVTCSDDFSGLLPGRRSGKNVTTQGLPSWPCAQ